MKMFIKLLALSVLFSSCLAVTLPKPIFTKLCETARSVRNLGLNNDELVLAMKSILKNDIRQLELPAHLKQDCRLEVIMTNFGIIQAMIMPMHLKELNDELLKALQSSVFTFEPTSNFSSVAASKVISSLNFDYCKNIDLPESVDTENQVGVQKAVIKIISSVIKQHKKATQSIEDYLSTVDKQLLTG